MPTAAWCLTTSRTASDRLSIPLGRGTVPACETRMRWVLRRITQHLIHVVTVSATLGPEFLKYWVGNSISIIGSQITLLAMPLAAVFMFGAGPAETGLLTALGSAPIVLLGLFVGAWIDRLP